MPRRKQNFMEGAAVLTLAVAATKVIGAVYKIPLGNLLDKDGMAHFYVAYNIYSLLLIVSTAGLPLALSRLVSRAEAMGRVNQRKRIFRVTAGVFFLLGVVCCGVMLLFAGPLAELLNDGQAAPAIRVLAPAVLCVCMLSAIRGYTQGRGDMRPTAVSQIIESTGKLLVGLTAAWLLTRRAAAPNMCAAGAISGVTAGAAVSLLVLAVWLLRSHGGQKGADIPDSRREILRQVLEIGIPVTLGSVGMSLITLLDQALVLGTLQSSLGLSEAAATSLYGEYTFGMTLFALPASFMYPLSISLVPSIGAAMAAGREEAAAKNAASALKLAMVLALPVGVGMSVLAGPHPAAAVPGGAPDGGGSRLPSAHPGPGFRVCVSDDRHGGDIAGLRQGAHSGGDAAHRRGREDRRQLPAGDRPGHLYPRGPHWDTAVLCDYRGAEPGGHCRDHTRAAAPGGRGGKAAGIHRRHGGHRLVRIRLPVPAHGCRGGYAAGYFGGGGGIHRAGAGAGGAAPGGDPAAAKGRETGKISI